MRNLVKKSNKEGNLLINAKRIQINIAALEPVKSSDTKETDMINEYKNSLKKPNDEKEKDLEFILKSRVVMRTTRKDA